MRDHWNSNEMTLVFSRHVNTSKTPTLASQVMAAKPQREEVSTKIT